MLNKRYECNESLTAVEILEEIARNRGCLLRGQELNISKACGIILDDFRSGKIGHITLETMEENE